MNGTGNLGLGNVTNTYTTGNQTLNVVGSAAGTVTIGNLALSNSTTSRQLQFGNNGVANGKVNITGTISDGGGSTAGSISILSNGSMKVTISGNNTYAGGTSIAGGTLILGSSSTGGVGTITTGPLGKGTFTINGGTSYSDSATARTIQNALTIGGNVALGNATNTGKLFFSADTALGAATRS